MKRIEIIANKSIQEDMLDAFKNAEIVKHYTLIPIVLGIGNSGPIMGDHVWPEENFSLTVYCDNQEADRIKSVITELKAFFTSEGIKLFELSS